MRVDWWWIAICFLCGSFQIYRGAPIDGLFFLGAALALVADSAGMLHAVDRYRVNPLPWSYSILGCGIVVAVITLSITWPYLTAAVVVVAGIFAVFVAWSNDSREVALTRDEITERRARRRAAIAWCALGVLLCLWELTAFFLGAPSPEESFEHPALTDLVEPLVVSGWGRLIGATLWVAGGVALVRRGYSR